MSNQIIHNTLTDSMTSIIGNVFEDLFNLETKTLNKNKIKYLNPNQKFKEIFDYDYTEIILDNTNHFDFEDKKVELVKSFFKSASLNKDNQGIRYTKYSFKGIGFGRQYSNCGLSTIKREVRGTICNSLYYDIDFVNCYPTILLSFCNYFDIDCVYLKEYVNNRQISINKLISLNPEQTYSSIKLLINSCLNGGYKDYNQLANKNNFIINLINEFKSITNEITSYFKILYEEVKQYKLSQNQNSTNFKGSTISMILQTIENQLMMNINDYLKNELSKTNYEKISFIYDGFMIPCDIKLKTIENKYIPDITKILNKSGVNMKLIIKPFETLNLSNLSKVPKEIKLSFQDNNDQVDNIIINYFDFNDNYYWSHFKNEISKITFESENHLEQFLINNLKKVCVFVNNNIILKKDPIDSFEIIKQVKGWCNTLNIKYTYYVKGEPKIGIIILSKYTNENMGYFNIFNRTSSNFSFPRNNEEFDLSKPFIAKYHDNPNIFKLNTFKDFLKEIICGNHKESFEYLWKWLAFTVKYPHLKTKVGIILISKQGSGKGCFTDWLCNYLYGMYNTIPNMNGMDQLIGEKNLHLLGKKLVVVNELSSTRDTFCSNSTKLKSLITEDDIQIRPLYCNAFSAKQTCEIIMSSNNINSVIIEESDRRYLVLNISELYLNDKDYFGNLKDIIYNQECGDSVYTDLMKQDLTINSFHRTHIPTTEKKQSMKDISKSSCILFIDYIIQYLIDNNLEFKRYLTTELYTEYTTFCSNNNEKPFRKTLFKSLILEYHTTFLKSNGKDFYIISKN